MHFRYPVVISLTVLFLQPPTASSQWIQTIDSTTVVSFAASDTSIYAGAYEEPFRIFGFSVFSSSTSGSSWTNVGNSAGGTNVSGLAINEGGIFAGTNSYYFWGVYRSTNHGSSWTATALNHDIFSLAAKAGKVFAGAWGGGVFVSTDNGASWNPAHIPFTGARVTTFAIRDSLLFAGTEGGGVYVSSNDGTSWIPANVGLTNTGILAVVATEKNLFAGSWGGGVFVSTNDGVTWTAASNGLTNLAVFALAATGTSLFAATFGGGVFLSTDNGASWTPVNAGLTGMNVVALAIHNGFLFSGTWNRGVWRRPLSELVSVEDGSVFTPEHFSLEQNYPNPFNPSTTISYHLGSRSHVTLAVFDILGREVSTLVNSIEDPGFKSVLWEASEVASGVYFYQLKAGPYIATRKMPVVR